MSERYLHSEEMLRRALETIPLGTQTFSKSKTQFPHGVSPYFVTHGKGCRVWDVDGNEYIDFINSLAAITLGYNDEDVTKAVRAQLDDGVIFSLAHPLEVKVAEKIVEMVPCAEMVRFGKNGSDATAGAVRLARAYTGRDRVAVCGYHGWQDWYIGTTARNRGVPKATRDLTHTFTYNDLDSLRRVLREYLGQVAAVVLEPMNLIRPVDGFLEGVKALAHEHGALLVFDETVTGFRYANGGAQEYFGVTPDLATFGKGVANGYPLSVIAGRADVMRLMEEIFFSFTFGGEALSLAAALATLEKLQREPVLSTLAERGADLLRRVQGLIDKHRLADVFTLSGHPAWSFLQMRDAGGYTAWEIKTLFLQEMFARGILTLGSHNMCYAHGPNDIDQLLNAYDEVMPILRSALDDRSLSAMLKCASLEPLFKVR
ncbi:aminotransferase class III-fold pyridoxal phosphate-dependent enzyme [Oxalobacteraceae bacterium OM1]|nr:aminotransferase class III-fold pyridoxal phosphate-dependent enzyme [Oxalobacteraceae bacterium OM1]